MSMEETFERLRRVPFEQVIILIAEEAYTKVIDEDIDKIISIIAHPAVGHPSSSWIEVYHRMGWTWDELVRESRRRLNG